MTTIFNGAIQCSIEEAITMIVADALAGAKNTFLLLGSPGIGKTAVAKAVAAALNYDLATMPMPTMQPEGLSIPVPNHDTGTTKDYISESWGIHHGKPLVIQLDEFTKAPLPMQNAAHPLFDGHPRRIGSYVIPDGSVVILTGNLPSVGVGDVLRSHTRNRVIALDITGPTAADHIVWGLNNHMHHYTLAFADQNPQLYLTYNSPEFAALDKDDPVRFMVFNPDPANPFKNASYFSPRALEACSNILWAWEKSQATAYPVNDRLLRAQLQGAIGVAAAEKLMATIKMGNDIPAAREIMEAFNAGSLDNMRRPVAQPAQMMMALQAPQWIVSAGFGLPKCETKMEANTRMAAWFQYMSKFTVPVQTAFVDNARLTAKRAADGTRAKKLADLMHTNPEYVKWSQANSYVW
jgi:hypothetical protein